MTVDDVTLDDAMDWSTLAVARELLERTNALVDANDAEDRGLQLLDPATDDPAIATGQAT